MRDFKYTSLVTGEPNWNVLMDNFKLIQSECLKPVAAALKANLLRTASFAILPAEMAFQSRRDTLFQVNAISRTSGKSEFTLDEFLLTEPTQELQRELDKQANEFEAINIEKRKEYLGSMGVLVTEVMAQFNPGMQASMDALLVSIVLESWLFFEAFCNDLWVASVDNAGKTILNRLGVFNQWSNPDEKVDPEEALNLDFNAKTHYGSYLREVGKVSFVKLHLIKKFFGAAFGKDAEKLFDSTCGGRIVVLSKVRNCIVHSAGRIDKEFRRFLDQSPRFPELQQFQGQDRILLDGQIVKELRQAALETGLALLKHADGVLLSGG